MHTRRQALLVMMATALLTGVIQAQSAEQLLEKTRNIYVAMDTYSDVGTVINEFGSAAKPIVERHSFTTEFRRSPRAFVFDFRKVGGDRYVVWGDPDAFHTWWKTTGAVYDFPNPNNIAAISGSGSTTYAATLKIPTLLYGKSQLAALLLAFAYPALDGTDLLSSHKCYRIVGRASDTYSATGREVNVRQITVWIDAESYLVRQVREQWKPAVAGQINRITTVYDPKANPPIDEAGARFTPPEAK